MKNILITLFVTSCNFAFCQTNDIYINALTEYLRIHTEVGDTVRVKINRPYNSESDNITFIENRCIIYTTDKQMNKLAKRNKGFTIIKVTNIFWSTVDQVPRIDVVNFFVTKRRKGLKFTNTYVGVALKIEKDCELGTYNLIHIEE